LKYHKKVIAFTGAPKEPNEWVFCDWVQGDTNPIDVWVRKELSDGAREILNSLLKTNRKTQDFVKWVGFKRFMQGELRKEKVFEIEFYADKRAYRVLMMTGEARKHAVILMGCYHKGKVYDPPDALNTAYKRAKELRSGRAGTHERTIEEDF
jgi:hypothetical protein